MYSGRLSIQFAFQFTTAASPVTCLGFAQSPGAQLTLSGTCDTGWTLDDADVIDSAYPWIEGTQFRMTGTAMVGGQACPATISGPLYAVTQCDSICETDYDAGGTPTFDGGTTGCGQ